MLVGGPGWIRGLVGGRWGIRRGGLGRICRWFRTEWRAAMAGVLCGCSSLIVGEGVCRSIV
jgi:hypothetical protein